MLSVHQHWDPLRVCAVGRCYPPKYFNYINNQKVRDVFYRIAEETEEDYQKLISLLEKFNVKVIRSDISDNPEDHMRPNGTMMSPPMVPRDYTAMVGNKFFLPGKDFGKNIDIEYELKVIMTTSSLRVNNMSEFHKDLLKYVYDLTFPGRPVSTTGQAMLMKTVRGMKEGNVRKILEAIDTEDLKNVIFQGYTNTIGKTTKYSHDDKTYPYKTLEKFVRENGNDIIYDQYINTASMIRVGRDLFFALGNIVTKMNENTFMNKWKKLFPDYNIHPVSIPGHSDGNLCPVKPGLLVSLRDAKTYADTFPDWEVVTLENQSWEKVKTFTDKKNMTRGRYWVPDADDSFYDYVNEWMDDWVTYVEETVFDVNMLVIDEKNVVCNNVNSKVFDAFERHGITPHIVNFRHRYFWDGGLHCITSDIHRDGERKDYFPDRDLDQ
tara:strand:- start:1626 stop:2933 length:1308 start_codon:yes stop_codon:yes gene_type:complete